MFVFRTWEGENSDGDLLRSWRVLGERHDLTYLSADERTYERDARKLETVEAALFGRARCRRAVRVGEPKGGRRRRCNLGPCNGRGGERERDVHAVAGRPRSAGSRGDHEHQHGTRSATRSGGAHRVIER